MTTGEEWYAGDHAVFAFRAVRCMAVTSSNLMETVIQLTHTAQDTIEQVDPGLIEDTAVVIAEILGA
jgi:aminopeptidase YwaD